jgi:alpha-L-fucosidase
MAGPSALAAWSDAPSASPLPADRFGTLAETTLTFPSGRWSLRTLSDDGIRLWADGELLIDDWTHHTATRHQAALDLGRCAPPARG